MYKGSSRLLGYICERIVVMTIDGSDSLVPVERKNHNSSAGKRTREILCWEKID